MAWFLLPHRESWDALLIIVERQGFVESVMHLIRANADSMGASVEFDTLGLLCYDTM